MCVGSIRRFGTHSCSILSGWLTLNRSSDRTVQFYPFAHYLPVGAVELNRPVEEMMNSLKQFVKLGLFGRAVYKPSCCRNISFASKLSTAYDADGKLTVTVMNRESDIGILIDAYSTNGFRLNNGVFILGPMVLFPNTTLSWLVEGDHDINEKSLSLFTLLEPKLDILIIGYGRTGANIPKLDRDLLAVRHRHKLNIEVLPTEKAVPTFNFLNAENRYVAAALIPPVDVSFTDDDIAKGRARRKQLYEE